MAEVAAVVVRGSKTGRFARILTPEALGFVASLEREFREERAERLKQRVERQVQIDAGRLPDFLTDTESIRQGLWTVSPAPKDLQKRWVEITGPAERKMMINALNSGANVFMADFEDAFTPTWDNLIEGQINLIDAIEGTIAFTSPEGKQYRLNDQVATLFVRPRGWHLTEKHALVDGEPISASLLDFGLYFFHNARRLLDRGMGPYFYLPKMESHREARLWNDVFQFAEDALEVPRGTIKATVLIETILAAFEMEEILYELREHSAGLNAGRWDYIFSVIKKMRNRSDHVLPDRAQITMTVPFMRAYTELLVKTCHRRGAHAIGGMAAFVPNRKNPEVTEIALARVREDKLREVSDGFDGTWVAHPDLVSTAMAEFAQYFGVEQQMGLVSRSIVQRANQINRQRDNVRVTANDLLDTSIPGGAVTEAGLHNNVSVALQYLESWLRGNGAVAIFDLMEDTATAEISRSQIWQWLKLGAQLKEGPRVTPALVRQIEGDELAKIRKVIGEEAYARGRFAEAVEIFEQVALSEDFPEFLTLKAYQHID